MAKLEERLRAVQRTQDQSELIQALDDTSAPVVEAAAKRLTATKAAGALVRTYQRLHDGAPEADHGCWARMAIVEALGRLDAPEAEEVVRLAVRTVQVEPVGFGVADTATGLRLAGATALANLRPRGALIDLGWLLFDTEPNAACSPQEAPFAKLATRMGSAKAIGQLGDPAGAPLLAVKLALPGDEVPDVLAECMDALVALEEPRSLEFLRPYLASTNAYLVAVAATAIAGVGRAAAVPVLQAALAQVVPDGREPLVLALGSIRADEARAALAELADHPDAVVRETARSLL